MISYPISHERSGDWSSDGQPAEIKESRKFFQKKAGVPSLLNFGSIFKFKFGPRKINRLVVKKKMKQTILLGLLGLVPGR